ncbi:MAG: murein biosynthesis integral membrane protein MurJ [Patescibacteria group bacterium]
MVTMWFKRLFGNGISESIAGAAMILGATTLASKLLGVVRNRILAGTFGAGDVLDSYYAAFRVPDLIFNIVVLGALSAGFIPVLVAAAHQEQEERRLAANVLNITLCVVSLFAALLMLGAPSLTPLFTPGFSPSQWATTISLTRIMALGPIFLAVGAVAGSVLQAHRRYIAYSFAPILYNLGIIFGAWMLVPRFGVDGLAYGVVIGTFAHMLTQLFAVGRLGFSFQWVLDLRDAAVRAIGKMMVPRTLSLAVSQLNFVAITVIASALPSGSISVFNLANDIQSFPLGLFCISLATAAFPVMSSAAAKGEKEDLKKSFAQTARLIFFFSIPSAVLLLLLRAQVVRVLLGWGNFDWNDTIATADVMALFALSLFAQGILPLVTRVFYALRNSVIPFAVSVAAVALNIALSLAWKDSFGVVGLAAAFSFSALFQAAVLWVILRLKLGSLGEGSIMRSLLKITFASVAMAGAVQGIKYIVAPVVDMQTFGGIFLQGFLACVGGIGVFIIVSLMLKNEEMSLVVQSFSKRFFRAKEVNGLSEEGGVGSG